MGGWGGRLPGPEAGIHSHSSTPRLTMSSPKIANHNWRKRVLSAMMLLFDAQCAVGIQAVHFGKLLLVEALTAATRKQTQRQEVQSQYQGQGQ